MTPQDARAHTFTIQAIGIVPAEKGGVKILSKKSSEPQKPAVSTISVLQGQNKSSRQSVAPRDSGAQIEKGYADAEL